MIIFCSAFAILMAGCTADMMDRQQSASAHDSEAWKYDETLAVPVILKAQEVETKAKYPINTLADMDWQMFGIFAVDKKKPEVEAMFMNNVAQYRHGTGEFMFGTQSGHVPERYYLYYPLDSEADYTFTAYCCKHSIWEDADKKRHVILPDYEVSDDRKKILVNVPVATSSDVLWGKAEAEGDGFNAKYMRQGLDSPKLKFVHPAAGLSFSASLADGVVMDRKQDSLVVNQLTFLDVPKVSKLCVYDCERANSSEGTFVADTQTGNASLAGLSGGSSTLAVPVMTSETKSIGQAIFIRPQSEPVVCRMRITYWHYSYKTDKQKWEWVVNGHYDYQFTLDPRKLDSSIVHCFEAGKYYRFKFNIGFNGKPYIDSISSIPNDQNP